MFNDRTHAGEILADKLAALKFKDPYILAVPRGGLAVAAPIAARLDARVAVLVAKKIGHPLNPEVAIGAVMPDGSLIHDNQYVTGIGVKQENFDQLAEAARMDLEGRIAVYAEIAVKNHEVKGRDVIIVDDGIATGYTIKAAVKWLKKWEPASLTVAVPVAPSDVASKLREVGVSVISVDEPDVFEAVGANYKDFSQITDQEALEFHRLSPWSVERV